jgi:hypothetical protein
MKSKKAKEMFGRRVAFSLFAVALISSDAGAYSSLPGRKNCPFSNPKNNWADYLSGRYGDKAPREPILSIRFSRNIGGYVLGGECYFIEYKGNGIWFASGRFQNSHGGYESKFDNSRGGLPENHEIKVWNYDFTFNEAGEVYWKNDDKLAGQMYCQIGNECWK